MQKVSDNNIKISKNDIRRSVSTDVVNTIVNDLQRKMKTDLSNYNDDIYSEMQSLGYVSKAEVQNKSATGILNTILNKAIDDYQETIERTVKNALQLQIKQLNLSQTHNPKIMVDVKNQYYRIVDGKYVLSPEIINVNNEGSYCVRVDVKNSQNAIIKWCDLSDKTICIKLINRKTSVVYKNVDYISKVLNFKKELVRKYKLHGYSGNSAGFLAKIGNLVTKPVEIGTYADSKYNFYKWNPRSAQFERVVRKNKSANFALLYDYEIKDDVIIRTDYDGSGLW